MSMMTLGNFFTAAPYARAVNPKPVTFTAVAKDKDILPGGKPNPTKKQIAAKIPACMVFIGDGLLQARLEARKYLRAQDIDPKTKLPLPYPINEGDFSVEFQYQVLARAIRQYDTAEKLAGDCLFAHANEVRELVELRECNRLFTIYDEYVKVEHPEETPDDATFRESEARST